MRDFGRGYRQQKPDVVLMDFAMARLNGLTACRNILSEDPSGCVLFLSGLSDRAELTPESSGAQAVLQKPITRARLEEVLKDAAARRHWERRAPARFRRIRHRKSEGRSAELAFSRANFGARRSPLQERPNYFA